MAIVQKNIVSSVLVLFFTFFLQGMITVVKPDPTRRVDPKMKQILSNKYLDGFFERTFLENKKNFQQLPKVVRLDILRKAGDAKLLILISMLPGDSQLETLFRILGVTEKNKYPLDLAVTDIAYKQCLVGQILNECNAAIKQAENFPIRLPGNQRLSAASHIMILPDCASILSDATHYESITKDDLLTLKQNLIPDIIRHPELQYKVLTVGLSNQEKVNLIQATTVDLLDLFGYKALRCAMLQSGGASLVAWMQYQFFSEEQVLSNLKKYLLVSNFLLISPFVICIVVLYNGNYPTPRRMFFNQIDWSSSSISENED